jgi:hypothetical protein
LPAVAAATKLPELVVDGDVAAAKDDEVDGDGFKVVHGKKDRSRTRTLSLKSLTETLKEVAQVSISPIFYEQLFHTNVFCAAFMYLQFGFVIYLAKGFWRKSCS